jgi:ABC-type sugar transport system substrate-binding protein
VGENPRAPRGARGEITGSRERDADRGLHDPFAVERDEEHAGAGLGRIELQALRDAGLAGGKVKFVAFDSGEMLNAGLLAGDVQGLVVQNPMQMGYLGVKSMVALLRGEKLAPVVDTGVGFVTKANFNSPEMADIVHPPLDKYLK